MKYIADCINVIGFVTQCELNFGYRVLKARTALLIRFYALYVPKSQNTENHSHQSAFDGNIINMAKWAHTRSVYRIYS